MNYTFLIIFTFFSTILLAENNRYFVFDKGIVSLIYHRFDEPKYPSTNVDINIFKKQMDIIRKNNYTFYNLKNFDNFFKKPDVEKKILISIDDAYSSFY